MNKSVIEIENYEIELLLSVINDYHGFNFKNYSRASLNRRIMRLLDLNKMNHISEMIPLAIHDNAFINKLLLEFSITVTEMFRDPTFWQSIRKNIIPYLKTYPYIKIWHAGCATGEEVYSMAILLKEEGILERTTLFATDFNEVALEKAKMGIYTSEQFGEYQENFKQVFPQSSLAKNLQKHGNSYKIDESIRRHITFANHNLVHDKPFGHMNIVICRNVLIYFDRQLQNSVLTLFLTSLVDKGFLAIGSKETIDFWQHKSKFDNVDLKNKIYQLVNNND